jgi:hypothetical protein
MISLFYSTNHNHKGSRLFIINIATTNNENTVSFSQHLQMILLSLTHSILVSSVHEFLREIFLDSQRVLASFWLLTVSLAIAAVRCVTYSV